MHSKIFRRQAMDSFTSVFELVVLTVTFVWSDAVADRRRLQGSKTQTTGSGSAARRQASEHSNALAA
jgi:hypothetical protein